MNNQVVFTFPSGSIALHQNDVVTTGNDLTIRKGAEVTFLEKSFNPFECKCDIKILPTGREEKISKHGCETTCFGVVLVCHYCVYDVAGVFKEEKSEICGVCVGVPF
jgi:hypothetical protein